MLRIALAKRVLGWALLVVPGAGIVLSDWARRGPQLHALGTKDSFRYWAFALFAGLLWGAVLHLALQRRTKWRFVALGFGLVAAIFAIGAQAYTFDRYQSYLDHRAVLVGT